MYYCENEHIYALVGCVLCIAELVVFSIYCIKNTAAQERKKRELKNLHTVHAVLRSFSATRDLISPHNENTNDDERATLIDSHVSSGLTSNPLSNPLSGLGGTDTHIHTGLGGTDKLMSSAGSLWKKRAADKRIARERGEEASKEEE
ncbi:hypothetical protein KIPB_004275, partial [Kipferlia bialata]|eukprot:g4275.t1